MHIVHSPLVPSHMRISPPKQQLAIQEPSLAKHSISYKIIIITMDINIAKHMYEYTLLHKREKVIQIHKQIKKGIEDTGHYS